MQHEDSRTRRDLFFCPLTLRYEVLCPLGPGWGCPHATEAGAARPAEAAAGRVPPSALFGASRAAREALQVAGAAWR